MKAEGQQQLSSAYKFYQSGQYKDCLTALQKIAKQPGDKNFNVLHNIYVLEYILNRNPQQAATTLNKLSDLVNDINNKKQTQKPAKGKQVEEKETKNDKPDEGTLKYNMAVLTGCLGRRDGMEMILDEIYLSGPNQFSWKIGFLLLESDILLDRRLEALSVIRKLNKTRTIPKKFADKDDKGKIKFTGITFPDNSAEHNDVCEEEYTYLLDLYRVQLALKFGLVKTANKLLPKKQTSRIFQGIREGAFVFKNTNLFELNLLSMLKFVGAQCEYEAKFYQKALRMLSPHNLMEVEINTPKYLNYINQLALNNIGLINFRLEKYTLALYYISKSLENISKTSAATVSDERQQLIVQHFQAKQEYLLVNQALVLLRLNKPKEAYEHFCRINKPSKSYKFWYRFGQAALQHYHQLLVENNQTYESDLYDQIHDNYDTTYSYPNLPYIKLDQSKKKPPANTNQKPPFYSRYVLRRSDNFIEEDSLQEGRKIEKRHSMLIHLRPILSKAQNCFENSYVCLSRIDAEKVFQSMELENISLDCAQDIEAEKQELHTKQVLIADYYNFKQSSLLILAYISLCKQQYPKTIKYCQELLHIPRLTDDNAYMASMYLVEAFLQTEKYKEAMQVSVNKWLKLGQRNANPIRCRDSLACSQSHFESMSPDNITRYNIAVLHIKGNNMVQANNVIQQLLNEMSLTVNSVTAKIPTPVLHLLIYWNIRTDNTELALQLLKRRRILCLPGMNNNKALLRITK